MSAITATESIVRRDRLIVVGGLTVVCLLCWYWLARGAGLGMNNMTTWQFPPPATGQGPIMEWGASYWLLMLAMWWVMMIAMMIPSAAPMILLYARVVRRAKSRRQMEVSLIPTTSFAAGYMLSWFGFSLFATVLHWSLVTTGLVHSMMMWSTSSALSAGFLIAAGVYQLSPVKNKCLEHCRAPADYLSRHWHGGSTGALRMGVTHGMYCIGCCWLLMGLLFVGGAMNLVWIGGLAVYVLIEKISPFGQLIARMTSLALLGTGVALLPY